MRLVLFYSLIFVSAMESRLSSSLAVNPCPEMCACDNAFCRIRGRSGRVTCAGVAVNCFRSHLTKIPDNVPLNVTGLLLSNNSIRVIDLDRAENFSRLSHLIIAFNNATELRTSRNIRRLRKLNLQGNHFVTLPTENLAKIRNLIELNLEDNWIQDIRYVRFPRKLEILNLNNNNLRALSAGSFPKLKALRVLKLNRNNIDHMNSNAFKYLTNLESLELEHNRLQTLARNAFAILPSVWYLNLKNNIISEIHPLTFRLFGFRNEDLHQIHLENNRIRFVERDFLGILIPRESRYSVYFAGNPIFCDCNLINLRNEASRLLGDAHSMICQSPEPYFGENVRHLHIDDCCF